VHAACGRQRKICISCCRRQGSDRIGRLRHDLEGERDLFEQIGKRTAIITSIMADRDAGSPGVNKLMFHGGRERLGWNALETEIDVAIGCQFRVWAAVELAGTGYGGDRRDHLRAAYPCFTAVRR